ncbi:hypothetical protein CDV31_016749 [Fusarium ambrosium]|uniref:Uncharacterized protein n=1 Tax=Fusarium ambrosium TaxID=131363 RepID=A0A428S330_9HYPO|nr:hypothetical protein CDV31_016749 [Fusarium ambrosium]
MEASLAFQIQQRSMVRIFMSEHKWRAGLLTEEEAIMMLNQGDDSATPVSAVLMFVPGIPIVVNHNTHQGLKLVNGASYSAAVEVIVDKAYQGRRISADLSVHFGPLTGIILESETTNDLHFVGMPPGYIVNESGRGAVYSVGAQVLCARGTAPPVRRLGAQSLD